VSGNGQQELLRAISGEELLESPAPLRLFGYEAGTMPVARRRALGMGFVPEERLGRGAVPQMSLAQNALLTAHRKGMRRAGLVDFGAARRFAADCIARFGVKAPGPQAVAGSLSGGNLQKFIVAREVLQRPKFGLSPDQALTLVGQLHDLCEMVRPRKRVRVVAADPDDNAILECAMAASAEIIVTGDAHLLDLRQWHGIRILSPAEAIQVIEETG